MTFPTRMSRRSLVFRPDVADCAGSEFAALASILGESYDAVARATGIVGVPAPSNRYVARQRSLLRLAYHFGLILERRPLGKFDPSADFGILWLRGGRGRDAWVHVVVLDRGRVYDSDGCVMSLPFYLTVWGARATALLSPSGMVHD